MHPSIRVLSSSTRQPLIKFLGKRTWPSTPESPHPHPAAPVELKKTFSDFVKKVETPTAAPSSQKAAHHEYWEAPERFWNPKVREIEEQEIEAILVSSFLCYSRLADTICRQSGGASLR
ncbi:hypothetical protein BD779DRAFT_1440831 [Infundibulicybe gibba]|nr:hypothetical protein BD779DRAFT_1440831 [Infundibulicybe gibba]